MHGKTYKNVLQLKKSYRKTVLERLRLTGRESGDAERLLITVFITCLNTLSYIWNAITTTCN